MSLTYQQFVAIADRQRVASDLSTALSIYYGDPTGLRWGDKSDEWTDREADRLLEEVYAERDEWPDDTTRMDIDIAMGAEGWQEPYWSLDGSNSLWVADPDDPYEAEVEWPQEGTFICYWTPVLYTDQNGQAALCFDDEPPVYFEKNGCGYSPRGKVHQTNAHWGGWQILPASYVGRDPKKIASPGDFALVSVDADE